MSLHGTMGEFLSFVSLKNLSESILLLQVVSSDELKCFLEDGSPVHRDLYLLLEYVRVSTMRLSLFHSMGVCYFYSSFSGTLICKVTIYS